jgi:hypothetical protein
LTQNYIEKPGDHPDVDLEEIGVLSFACRFKPGMDADHRRFASENDARETFETWEACRGEGIRTDTVHTETNPLVDQLHEQSIQQMRQDLVQTDKAGGMAALSEEDSKRYTDKYGMDWSKVFDNANSHLGGGSSSSASNHPGQYHDSHHYRHRQNHDESGFESDTSSSPEDSDIEDSDDSYHHVTSSHYHERSSPPTASAELTDEQKQPSQAVSKSSMGPIQSLKNYRANQKSNHRRQRGLMQWKPIRSLAFAKDEAKFGAQKLKNKVKLRGRHPDVETEV